MIAAAGLMALAVAVGIGRFAFTPILPMMVEDAGLSVVQGGWLAAANYLGYLAGAAWAMLHRVRPDRAIRAALAITALSTLAMAYADGLGSWLALRTIAGIASAWGLIHVSAWCVEALAHAGKAFLNGGVFAGVGVGILLAGSLCLALMQAEAASRTAWLALGAIALAVTAFVWPVLGVSVSGGPGAGSTAGRYRWTPDALRLVFCYGAFGLGYIIPATFVPVMAKQAIRDPAVFGLAWPIFGLAAAASTLVAAPLLRAFGNRRVWMGAASLMALGVIGPVVLPGLPGIVVAALLVGATFMVTTMAGIQEAREVAGRHAAVLVAAFTAAFAAGQIAGPLLVSLALGRGAGFSHALLAAFVVLAISVVALTKGEKGWTRQ